LRRLGAGAGSLLRKHLGRTLVSAHGDGRAGRAAASGWTAGGGVWQGEGGLHWHRLLQAIARCGARCVAALRKPAGTMNSRGAPGRFALTLIAAVVVLGGCHSDGREPLTLYSPHDRTLLAAVESRFEAAHPDIDLRWLDMGSQEILGRLRFYNPNPVAALWFRGPTTLFHRGVAEGVLQSSRPSWGNVVHSAPVGPDGKYWPVSRTPAVIAFNTNLISPD